MYKIKSSVIESICHAAKESYPNEFIALLSGNPVKKIVKELVVLPSIAGKEFASIRLDLLPLDRSVFGSVHSHPNYSNRPSAGDIGTFPKMGKIHLIICNPFTLKDLKLFDSSGKNLNFEIIQYSKQI